MNLLVHVHTFFVCLFCVCVFFFVVVVVVFFAGFLEHNMIVLLRLHMTLYLERSRPEWYISTI